MKPKLIAVLMVPFLAPEIGNTEVPSDLPKPGEARIIHFEGSVPKPNDQSVELQYEYDLANESFELFVPKNYSGEKPFGLFVFIDSQNEMTLPQEWRSTMEQRKLISAIPQRVGNDQPAARRMGLAVIGILKTSERYQIDPKRIIVSGFSGGARCALHVAFVHAGLISGSLSICGADFYEPVAKVKATDTRSYGVWPVGRVMADRAKSAVRFTFITGDKDHRRGNILDIHEGGFVRNGFHVHLIDVRGMGHQLCAPDILGKGLDYLDGKD